jgi:hypothetical protein
MTMICARTKASENLRYVVPTRQGPCPFCCSCLKTCDWGVRQQMDWSARNKFIDASGVTHTSPDLA